MDRLRGFVKKVTFFSIAALTPHKTKRRREAKTTRSCFGKVKKSVVIVKKNTGKSKNTNAITIVAIEFKYSKAPFFSM